MTYEAIAIRLPGIGSKRVCVSCATRFYDLARSPPVCPKCGTEQPPEVPRPPPMRRSPATRHRMMKGPSPAAREADDDAAPVLLTDDDEVEADEDADVAEVDADADDDVEVEAVLDSPALR
jgi:uncharacterized protein (TIGR02300 family)